MPHAIWKGTISFGLVTIPVDLLAAEQPREIAFHLLDDRDLSPIRNRRVNEATGDEVPWEHVAKGFDLGEGRRIIVTEDDLRAANVEATQTIDVLAAVCADDIDPKYYDRPYYMQPERAGRLSRSSRASATTRCAKSVTRSWTGSSRRIPGPSPARWPRSPARAASSWTTCATRMAPPPLRPSPCARARARP